MRWSKRNFSGERPSKQGMNFILQLKRDINTRNLAIEDTQDAISAFLGHLHSEKFAGTDSEGARKDWISTADVIARLQELRSSLTV